jgi:hypothetical protein
MGARAGWPLLMDNPDIFAASVISSGATFAQPYQLQALLGNTIRNYYGANDENGLSNATLNTQANYVSLLFSSLPLPSFFLHRFMGIMHSRSIVRN